MKLHSRCKELDLSTTQIMGILNLTPDSFSDGGRYQQLDRALYHINAMVEAGATIIDIGGESTRPNATPVDVEEELERVIPVIERAVKEFDVFLSIDTYKPLVMQEASLAGVDMINDIWALRQPGALDVARDINLPICLMHMQGTPQTMQQAPHYEGNACTAIINFLSERITACINHGISRNNLIVDPGFGFGKNLNHNYEILSNISEFTCFNLPILIGLSRKSMLNKVMTKNLGHEKLIASVTGAVITALQGANIVRVHDVAETATAVKIVELVLNSRNKFK